MRKGDRIFLDLRTFVVNCIPMREFLFEHARIIYVSAIGECVAKMIEKEAERLTVNILYIGLLGRVNEMLIESSLEDLGEKVSYDGTKNLCVVPDSFAALNVLMESDFEPNVIIFATSSGKPSNFSEVIRSARSEDGIKVSTAKWKMELPEYKIFDSPGGARESYGKKTTYLNGVPVTGEELSDAVRAFFNYD